MNSIYELRIDITSSASSFTDVVKREYLKFTSKNAARIFAKKYAECIDVKYVMVLDTETGEIILEIDSKGKIIWDAEG